MENSYKRLVSRKTGIREITGGEFIQMEGWEPSYVMTRDGRRISRANLIATIVSTGPESGTFLVDDGSGTISLRSFGEINMPEDVSVGDIVFVIGKVRKFGEEIYIAPEIIRKTDNPAWLRLRKMELKIAESEGSEAAGDEEQGSSGENESKAGSESAKGVKEEDEPMPENGTGKNADGKTGHEKKDGNLSKETAPERVCRIIKELDAGKGANMDEVIEKCAGDGDDAEKIIKSLLEEGEIFEIRPGKLKVLE